jgi:Holliday junction DNA helicase RuvA
LISYIKGKVIEKGPDHMVVLIGGFGLEVRAPAGTIEKAPAAGSEVALHTYLHVRDDALQLYGFDAPRGRDLFVKLMSVSGFGASKALAVLSIFSPEVFEEVVQSEDADRLTVIPGVGKKGAQRLLLEMKDKVEPGPPEAAGVPEGARQAFAEATEALLQLGYTRAEAYEALRKFPAGAEAKVEEMLQFALKSIGGTR